MRSGAHHFCVRCRRGLLARCDLDVALVDGGSVPDHLVTATNCRRPSDCTYGWGTALKLVDNGSAQRTEKDKVGGGCPQCPTYQGFDIVVELGLDEYVGESQRFPTRGRWRPSRRRPWLPGRTRASFALDSHLDEGCFCDVKNDSSWQVFAGWIGDGTAMTPVDRRCDATAAKSWHIPRDRADGHRAGVLLIVQRRHERAGAGQMAWRHRLPVLRLGDDPWSLTSANPRRAWTFTESASEIVDRVWGTSSTLDLVSAEVIATNVSGSAKTIRFVGAANDGSLSTRDKTSQTVTRMVRPLQLVFLDR